MSDRGAIAERGRQFEVHENTSYLLNLFLYHFQKITRYSEFPMYYIFINWTWRALLLLQHALFKIHEHDIFQIRPTLKGFTRYKVNTFSTYLQFHIKKTHNTDQNEQCSSPSPTPHLSPSSMCTWPNTSFNNEFPTNCVQIILTYICKRK